MRKFIIVASTLFTFSDTYAQKFPSGAAAKNLNYKIIPSAGKTWGYDIYSNGRLIIHQPGMPALAGNAGFATKAAAEKVAKKVMQIIGRGKNPPTITVDEMKRLGAIPGNKQAIHF